VLGPDINPAGAIVDGNLHPRQLAPVAARPLDCLDRDLVAAPAETTMSPAMLPRLNRPSRPIFTLREKRSVCSGPLFLP